MSADSSETPTPEESGTGTPDGGSLGGAPTPQPLSDTAGHWIPPSLEHLQALLPNYEFLEILGHGGMGAVYKARQLSLDRLVAIKILPPGIAVAGDTSFVERFKNEARTMAKMNHPGIVNVYDFGQTADGQLFLVMEYIDGTDVAKMVHSQGRLPQEYALAIAAHVCDALQYAHTHGVIHRDIKPANVLINMEGQVKVADFGLAKAKTRGAQSTALTDTNITMGTPDYVAPEALVMGIEPDHRADLYAMGVMLYNMLTGEIPRGRFKPVSEKTGGDPRFDIIINKAMQERDARYQTALNMRRDLDVILTVPLAKSDATSSTIPKQFAQQNAIRKPVARRPSAPHTPPPAPPSQKSGALVGIIVLALLAGGGYFGWKQFSKPNAPAAASSAAVAETNHPTNPNPPPVTSPVTVEKEQLHQVKNQPAPTLSTPPNAGTATTAWDKTEFTPLFDANGILGWRQHGSGGQWGYARGVLSCRVTTKGTARLWCPKDFAPADFEIRFSVRGDRGPAFEFRQDPGDPSDHCYRVEPTALPSNGSVFWGGRGGMAKAGQRIRVAPDDQREELSKFTARSAWNSGDWNEVVISAQGHHLSFTCNGALVAEVTDESSMYHAGPGEFGFRVTNNTDGELSAEFRDIFIKKLGHGELPVAAGTPSHLAPPPITEGPGTDVLPLVQLPRDLSEGPPPAGVAPQSSDWKLEAGLLSASFSGFNAIVCPDFAPPESYDLSLRVKASPGPNSNAGVIVPVGGKNLMVMLQRKDFEATGFEVIDGKTVPKGGLTTIRPAMLNRNMEQLVEISVRSHHGEGSVALKVNGKPILDWSGKESSLSLYSDWNRMKAHRLGLCAHRCGVTFRDVRLRRADDIVTPPAITNAPASTEKWTDWLAEQRRIGKLPSGLVEDGVGYKVSDHQVIFPLGPAMRDGAIRVMGKRRSSSHFLLLLRCLEPGFKPGFSYSFIKAYRLSDDAHGLTLNYRDAREPDALPFGGDKGSDNLISPDDGSKNHIIELRVVGNVVSVIYDGKLLLNTRDTHLTVGQPCLYADVGAYFEKIEVLNLDGPRLPPLLLSQYTAALTRERDAARPEEKGAYNVELARLKTDPTLPLADAPGTSDALAKLRKTARATRRRSMIVPSEPHLARAVSPFGRLGH